MVYSTCKLLVYEHFLDFSFSGLREEDLDNKTSCIPPRDKGRLTCKAWVIKWGVDGYAEWTTTPIISKLNWRNNGEFHYTYQWIQG